MGSDVLSLRMLFVLEFSFRKMVAHILSSVLVLVRKAMRPYSEKV